MKIDDMKYLKKHLKTQIKTANSMGSKWVYILTTEAEKCLKLAEEKQLDVFMETEQIGKMVPGLGSVPGAMEKTES